jgi:starvation-inducible outer membrane lipoprotein
MTPQPDAVRNSRDAYNFSVSEVFSDGRVLVCTYVRIGGEISLVMDVYDNLRLEGGRRYLNLQHTNGGRVPAMQPPSMAGE